MIMEHVRPALVLTMFFVAITGIAFPVAVWTIAAIAFPRQAHGSLLRDGHGQVIGSSLLGQAFTKPEYFHPRPSAAGTGYDAANSSGSNLGPTSHKLIHEIEASAAAYRAENGLAADAVIPADAATRSASGLDPDISPENAQLQAARVARERKLVLADVQRLVTEHTRARTLGLFGEPRVNVLELNLALDAQTY